MYTKNSGLIPAKFLTLIAHLTVCIVLLCNTVESVESCSPPEEVPYDNQFLMSQQTEFVVGLGIAVGMIVFELLAFITGFTMFRSSSSFLSIVCHSCATVFLTNMIFQNWQCGWFWWIFAFCSAVPLLNDFTIVVTSIVNRLY